MQNVRGPLVLKIIGQRAQSHRLFSCLSPLNCRPKIYLKNEKSHVRQMSVMATVQEKYISLANDFIVWIAKLPPTIYIQGDKFFLLLHRTLYALL